MFRCSLYHHHEEIMCPLLRHTRWFLYFWAQLRMAIFEMCHCWMQWAIFLVAADMQNSAQVTLHIIIHCLFCAPNSILPEGTPNFAEFSVIHKRLSLIGYVSHCQAVSVENCFYIVSPYIWKSAICS